MDALDFAAPVLTTVLSVLAVAWLSRRSGNSPEMRDGLLQFRMARSFGILGWFVGGLGTFMAVGAAMEFDVRVPMSFLFALMAAASLALAVLLIREGLYHRAACNDEVLVVIDRRDRMESCRWSDIAHASVNTMTRHLVLLVKDGRKLRINIFIAGGDALFRIMARRTALPVADLVAKARSTG